MRRTPALAQRASKRRQPVLSVAIADAPGISVAELAGKPSHQIQLGGSREGRAARVGRLRSPPYPAAAPASTTVRQSPWPEDLSFLHGGQGRGRLGRRSTGRAGGQNCPVTCGPAPADHDDDRKRPAAGPERWKREVPRRLPPRQRAEGLPAATECGATLRKPPVAPAACAGARRRHQAPRSVHPATHRASDGALASSQLRVPGREYPFRDAEPADHAPVMAIRFSLIPAGAPARSRAGGVRPGWPRIRAGRSLPGPGPGASTSGRARRGQPSWRRPGRRPWSTSRRA